MPAKRLDHSTLEVIAETICGAGPSYEAPGPYRTKSEIYSFFQRAGVNPQGQSSTRKWFVLESLQACNVADGARLIPSGIERVLLRLGNPQEYRGDANTTNAVITHLNRVLHLEGLEIILIKGISPQIKECEPTLPPVEKPQKFEPSPDFAKLVGEPMLAELLAIRWEEAQRCIGVGAYLSAIIMMGSILEGVLLAKVEADQATACRAVRAPKKDGKSKPIHEWNLNNLIEVANEVGWLQGDVRRFSHSLRESRNMVHPYVQRAMGEFPDKDTCSICWQVVRAAVADLLNLD